MGKDGDNSGVETVDSCASLLSLPCKLVATSVDFSYASSAGCWKELNQHAFRWVVELLIDLLGF